MHADAEADAKRLEAMIRERVPNLGTVEHHLHWPRHRRACRAGDVASVFMGKERTL